MGNCVFRGFAAMDQAIKVVTPSGGVMELYMPVTAECITNEFSGYGIFSGRGILSQPLLHNEELQAGELYYLLPLRHQRGLVPPAKEEEAHANGSASAGAPYRMSFDHHGLWRRAESEVFSRWNSRGVWRVKLVISPEQLSEILSHEAQTEALIENVRMVAKCGSGSMSSASSDQWSLSSSRKGSLERTL
ncbi:hypothetical protein ACLOJK_006311 [Asimina triloba]